MRELSENAARARPAALALKDYEVSMKNAPNRLRGYYGAGQGRRDGGREEEGRSVFQAARATHATRTGNRAELREMRRTLR